MGKDEFLNRIKKFAISVFKLVDKFPKSKAAEVIPYQLLKSSSSVAANHRASYRAKSKQDFINKLKIITEEADESLFWLTFINDVEILKNDENLDSLIKEANELTAIFTSSLKTSKQNSILTS